jgi:hypothetical protein
VPRANSFLLSSFRTPHIHSANVTEAASTTPSTSDWVTPRRFALLLAAMIAIPFWDVLLGLKSFVLRDYGLYSYPVAYYLRESYWHGEWPLWNPYSCCGLPFLAQFNTLALYPPSLFYLVLPLTWALGLFCLLHLFWAGMGMYFLTARWTGSRAGAALAAVVFAFNGLTMNFLMWPSHLATFAWVPWVILLAEDAWAVGGQKLILAALAAAMEVLAGGPEEILVTWLILAALAIGRLRNHTPGFLTLGRRFLAIGLIAAGLSAAQSFPFVDLVLHSNRNTHFANSAWSMPPWGWANFLVPLFQTNKYQAIVVQRSQYWTSSYYVGIGVALLVVMALWRARKARVWLFGFFFLAGVILALGDSGFAFHWLKQVFPILGMFRYPVKFVIATVIATPILAAYAIAHYETRKQPDGARWTPEFLTVGAMLAFIAIVLWLARIWPLENTSVPATVSSGLSRAVFLAMTLAALYIFVARPARRGATFLLILALCWGDLVTHMPWQNPTVDPTLYQPGLGVMCAQMTSVPKFDDSRLMMSPYSARQLYYKPATDMRTNYIIQRAMFLADCNLLDALPKVDGFFSLSLRGTDKVLWLLDSSRAQELNALEDFLSVSQTVASGKVFDWVARTNYIPIVTIGQEPIFAGEDETFGAIQSGKGDFRNTVYLPPEAKSSINATPQPSARIVSKDFGAMRQKIEVETPGTAMLVLTEAFYHNWTVQIDRKPAQLWRANFAFEAVEVPAGSHEVLLVYKDRAFQVGGLVSLCSLLVCAAGWVILRKPVVTN